MPKLAEQEHKMKYFFRSNNGRCMQKFSGDNVSESEVKEFEIPDYLLERPLKNKEK